MLPFEDRYTRQRRLPEVGPQGQERLCSTRLRVGQHPDVDLEVEYLARAGVVAVVAEEPVAAPSFPFASWFENEASLGLARGAWCALSRIRAELGAKP